MKYPKAFEVWWHRHEAAAGVKYYHSYKRAMHNAWKAGRKHQKSGAYAYGDIVRYSF